MLQNLKELIIILNLQIDQICVQQKRTSSQTSGISKVAYPTG